jgi:hypothetical protein
MKTLLFTGSSRIFAVELLVDTRVSDLKTS